MLILKQLVLLFANYSDVDVLITFGKKWAVARLEGYISGSQLDNLSYL